jgi:hypothetical protein
LRNLKKSVSRPMGFLVSTAMFLLVTLLPLGLFGQTTGTIGGQVSDQSGAAVSAGVVQVTNLGTVRTATINAEGVYQIFSLPVGAYRLTVERVGFKQFSQPGITLQVGQTARVDAVLLVGSVTQSVNASGATLSVDTTSPTVGEEIDNRIIESVPLNRGDAEAAFSNFEN